MHINEQDELDLDRIVYTAKLNMVSSCAVTTDVLERYIEHKNKRIADVEYRLVELKDRLDDIVQDVLADLE